MVQRAEAKRAIRVAGGDGGRESIDVRVDGAWPVVHGHMQHGEDVAPGCAQAEERYLCPEQRGLLDRGSIIVHGRTRDGLPLPRGRRIHHHRPRPGAVDAIARDGHPVVRDAIATAPRFVFRRRPLVQQLRLVEDRAWRGLETEHVPLRRRPGSPGQSDALPANRRDVHCRSAERCEAAHRKRFDGPRLPNGVRPRAARADTACPHAPVRRVRAVLRVRQCHRLRIVAIERDDTDAEPRVR